MLSNVLLKTLYEKRWMTLGWSLGVIALVVMTVTLFPTFKDSFGSMKDVPESLKALIGDAAAYSTIQGYVNLQVFQQMPFMTIILSVILFSGLIAGEEGEGILQTQLVQPVSRSKLFVQKLIAGSIIVGIVTIAILAGTLLSITFINEPIPFDSMLAATFACWIIAMVFGILAYVLGTITGKRGLSGGIVGALAFTTYLISGLAKGVDQLRLIEKASPFHYYNSPSILENGINWLHIGVLSSVMVGLLIIAIIVFEKRDVYQR